MTDRDLPPSGRLSSTLEVLRGQVDAQVASLDALVMRCKSAKISLESDVERARGVARLALQRVGEALRTDGVVELAIAREQERVAGELGSALEREWAPAWRQALDTIEAARVALVASGFARADAEKLKASGAQLVERVEVAERRLHSSAGAVLRILRELRGMRVQLAREQAHAARRGVAARDLAIAIDKGVTSARSAIQSLDAGLRELKARSGAGSA